MFLQRIHIRNFRCFDDKGIEIIFQPGVNVVIGENNTGKSALIDALRLGFSLGAGRRDIYVSTQDFHLCQDGTYADEITLDFIFGGLSEEEQAMFYEMLVLSSPITAQLHLRYKRETQKGIDRIRLTVWGGEKEGQTVSFETLDLMNHVFLEALRDAESDLRPGRGSRLGQLLRKLVTDDSEKEKILRHVVDANRNILKEDGIKQAGEIINRHLFDIERSRLQQDVRLGLVTPEFDRVADSLRVLLPLSGIEVKADFTEQEWNDFLSRNPDGSDLLNAKSEHIDNRVFIDLSKLSESEQQTIGENAYAELLEHVVGIFELDQNGMGYNNLIYMGVVLGDLRERKNIEPYSYNSLLIEEPEAHLHPQLQDLVFDFLKRVSASKDEDGKDEDGNDQGPIQVFVTSHSPTLTSRADIDSVIVLHKSLEDRVAAIPLRKCPLCPSQKADLRRYLDVTKSQLFFAKGVILTEGISEALLLPVFAKRLGRRLDHNAVEVVNISGTAFEPFALLFNSDKANQQIGVPCAIITDDDRCTSRGDLNRLTDEDMHVTFVGKDKTQAKEFREKSDNISLRLKGGKESDRSVKARSLKGGNLIVRTAFKTFEYELARTPANVESMLIALECVHPIIAKRLRELFAADVMGPEHMAVCLWLAIKDSKARFAQRLAAILDEYDASGSPKFEFKVPSYIEDVLEYVAPVRTLGKPA